jgi:hypothetical protein
MSVQKGTALVWGVGGFSLDGTGVYATGIVQSVQYSLGGEEAETRGPDGKVENVVFYAKKEELTVEVIPSGSSIADAKGNAVLPARGADVTVATDVGGFGETFIFVTGSINQRVDGACSLTMNLRRYEDELATVP